MTRFLSLLLVFVLLMTGLTAAGAQSPFSGKKADDQVGQAPPPQNPLLTRLALYQQQLKQRMAALIRQVKTSKNLHPLMVVLMIAFGYGVLHAAGPGHGKAVAMSFMMSRHPSLGNGLLFGALIAFAHGFSGILCVLGLHYLLKKSITGSLAGVSHITEIVSYSLIALLGSGILFKNARSLFSKTPSRAAHGHADIKTRNKSLIPWALLVGLVPCPGVVMVMLFCLSMETLALGLLLAVCITLGMAATISFVVTVVVMGKAGILNAVSEKRAEMIEHLAGLLSGTAVLTIGTLFLLASLHAKAF